MIDTKLLLLDGLTGAGKSTTAQRLWLHLERQGYAARWFYEHDVCHPIWRPDEQARMAEAGALDPGFVQGVLPMRWRNLAGECRASEQATILEGTLFQSTVGFLLAMNLPDRAIEEHVLAVEETLAGLAPILVYFRPRDVAQSLQAVFEDRRADGYAADLIRHIARTPYGRDSGLSDFTGLVRFYEHWISLVERLAARMRMANYVLEEGSGDWPSRERRLTEFLGLPPIGELQDRIDQPSRFIGRYRDAGSADELVVAGNEDGLHLDDARRTRLIPARDGGFHIAAMCAELSFGEESGGVFQRIELRGNLPGLSPVWIRMSEGGEADAARSGP
nr:hypothetical protein [uncultured bacterium]